MHKREIDNVHDITILHNDRQQANDTIASSTGVISLPDSDRISNTTAYAASGKDTCNSLPQTPAAKRRKTDLICIICEGDAAGYNFNRISCHSCKEFFRRNALQPIEKIRCLNEKNGSDDYRCEIRFDIKRKCQRCRLLKCFELGMRKDFIATPEEKLLRQQRIEENRRLRSDQRNSRNRNNEKSQNNPETIIVNTGATTILSSFLTEADQSYLREIQKVYLSTMQSGPSVSSLFSFELSPDQHSAFAHTMNLENFMSVRVINFLRSVSDFTSLNDHDRLILVKYNLTSMLYIDGTSSFDSIDEASYFNTECDPVSSEEKAFAHFCKELYGICYGSEAVRIFLRLLRALAEVIDNDRTIEYLIMLIMIFLKGLSVDDDQAPLLVDPITVFHTQTKFTDLFFRYLLDKFSWNIAVTKTARMVEQILKIQNLSQDYDPFVKSKAARFRVNPLMKSLLHLT